MKKKTIDLHTHLLNCEPGDSKQFFGLIYVPVDNFSVMRGRVFLGLTSTKQWFMCLAQRHNTATLVWLKHSTPWFVLKHSTTEPLGSCTAIKFQGWPELAHNTLIHTAYEQMPLINIHAEVSSEARGINFGWSCHLHPHRAIKQTEDKTAWKVAQ